MTSPDKTRPLAMRELDAFVYLTGRPGNRMRIKRLRDRGHFPHPFYLGNQAFVLTADLDALVVARLAAAPQERAALEERSHAGVVARSAA